MYESPVLPIRMKIPWKNQYSFYQSHFPYTLFASKSRNSRRSKSRNVAFICLMFFVSVFLLCHHYQNISLDGSSHGTDDALVDVSSSSLSPVLSTPVSSLSTKSQSFSLSTLLWPRQMFSSQSQSLSAADGNTVDAVKSDDDDDDGADDGQREERTEEVGADVNRDSQSKWPHLLPEVQGEKSEKRLPQVIIIGVRKCGTRALLEFLNLHSRIQKARDEVHFFDEDTKYALGLPWYKSQMPYSYAHQVTIEKTPAYFVTDSAPERIRAMNSSIRLILLVRDPVTRLISDYAQLNANKLAKKERPLRSIEQMVLLEDGSVNVNYRPVKTSIYSYYYTKWAETFPSSQIHVVDGDRLIDDPYSELVKVIQFLKLNPDEISSDQFTFNATKGFFCIKVFGSDAEKCLNETKGRRHPNVEPAVVQVLRKFYAPYNRHFYSLVGRDFNWREE